VVTGNTSVNRGSGTRLAVADAVLDVCVYYYYSYYYDDSDIDDVYGDHVDHDGHDEDASQPIEIPRMRVCRPPCSCFQVIAEVPVGFEAGDAEHAGRAFDA